MPSIINAATSGGLISTADTSGELQLQTASTTALTITSARNVGIGTSSPTNQLDVFTSSGGTQIVRSSNSALRLVSSSGENYIQSGTAATSSSPAPLIFSNVGGTGETMRIDSSGNLLIGQSVQSGNEKLLVLATQASSLNIRIRNDSTSASASAAIVMNASGNSWGIECGSSAKNSNALTWQLDYGGTNAERLRLNTDGTLILRGGSTSATGTGITFPATQSASSDANTLDDYEEGTWTPTIIGTTVTGTASYTQNSARYTKIGRMVFVETYISWSGGTGSGALRIAGLPFTSSATETYPGLAVSYFENIVLSASNVPMAYFINNNTAIGIYQCPVGGGANSAVTYDAAGGIQVSGCYTV